MEGAMQISAERQQGRRQYLPRHTGLFLACGWPIKPNGGPMAVSGANTFPSGESAPAERPTLKI
jgi:hypothetical protein